MRAGASGPSDAESAQRALGDRLEELRVHIFHTLRHGCGLSEDDAAQFAQDAIVKALEQPWILDLEKPRAYLKTVARNALVDALRRDTNRRKKAWQAASPPTVQDSCHTVDAAIDANTMWRYLLKTCGERCALAYCIKIILDITEQETAQILTRVLPKPVTRNMVKHDIEKARKHLAILPRKEENV